MPIFIAALLGGLVQAAGSMVGRVLISLGVSFVSYAGISTLLSAVQSAMFSNLSALPAGIVGVLGLLKIGTITSIIFSAFTVRMTLSGLTSGAMKKMVLK